MERQKWELVQDDDLIGCVWEEKDDEGDESSICEIILEKSLVKKLDVFYQIVIQPLAGDAVYIFLRIFDEVNINYINLADIDMQTKSTTTNNAIKKFAVRWAESCLRHLHQESFYEHEDQHL